MNLLVVLAADVALLAAAIAAPPHRKVKMYTAAAPLAEAGAGQLG